jgi:hypothetical protein
MDALGKLFLRKTRLGAQLKACAISNSGARVSGFTIVRVLHPFLVQMANFAHSCISRARFTANLISCAGVSRVFFTKTRTTITRLSFAVK